MLYYSWKFVISALALNILRSPSVLSQCEPIEEGKSHTITCSGAACNNPLLYKWSTFPARPASQHIAHCDTTMDCTGNNNFFAIDVAQDGVGYISNLTIRRVSLTEPFNNELTWTCDYCGQRVKSCALQIFVKPVEPKCQASEITDGNGVLSKLKLSCSMERVYPTARCLFQKVAKNDSIVTLQQTVNSCNNTIDVSEFHDGVNMIQAIVGSTRQPDFDQIQPIRVSPDIRLRLPTSSVECPDVQYSNGFYKAESMTCLCKLADAGKPRGSPEWFQNGDGLSVETLTIRRRSPNQPAESLVCAGVSAIGQESPGTTFSPKYAFLRPGTINYTTTYESRSEESCCGNAGVFATCEITATEVNPAPRIVFLVDDIEIPSQQDDADEKYRSTARFRPEVGGIFRLECQIKNAIFPDLVEGSEANVTIHSPVQFAQSSKVIERYSIKIDPDSPVTINADITAYPRATNFTLYKGTLEQNITVDDYGVKYIELSPSAGTVELTMRINSSLDLTTYALLIENGIGDGLVYSFILEEDEDDLTLVYIIVGVIAGVLVIAAIVVAQVCCWVRRRKQSLSPLSEKKIQMRGRANRIQRMRRIFTTFLRKMRLEREMVKLTM